MSVLLDNGVPLIEALELVISQIESSRLLSVTTRVKEDIEAGLSFRDAVA